MCSEYKSFIRYMICSSSLERFWAELGQWAHTSLLTQQYTLSLLQAYVALALHQDFLGQRVPWLSHRSRKPIWPPTEWPLILSPETTHMPLLAQ